MAPLENAASAERRFEEVMAWCGEHQVRVDWVARQEGPPMLDVSIPTSGAKRLHVLVRDVGSWPVRSLLTEAAERLRAESESTSRRAHLSLV